MKKKLKNGWVEASVQDFMVLSDAAMARIETRRALSRGLIRRRSRAQEMKRDPLRLHADELIQALTDVRDHVTGRRKITMRSTKVALPARAQRIRPAEIRGIRRKLKVSRP